MFNVDISLFSDNFTIKISNLSIWILNLFYLFLLLIFIFSCKLFFLLYLNYHKIELTGKVMRQQIDDWNVEGEATEFVSSTVI